MENINIKDLKVLIEMYRKSKIAPGDHILCVEFSDRGKGSIIGRKISGVEKGEVSYKESSYNYVDVTCDTTHVMYWTDNNFDEPYNRMYHNYVPYSFETLGAPVKEEGGIYFYNKLLGGSDIIFKVWGFTVNDFWEAVRFGVVVGPDDVEFVKDQIVWLLGAFQ